MKKLLFLIVFCLSLGAISQAQITRNDSYSAIGALTSLDEIPFGVSLYTIEKDQKFGFFTELKLNRLSFGNEYNFQGSPLETDTLRNAEFIGDKKMVKMINIGTVFNPQQVGIMQWDVIDIDFCLGLGYMQDFRYKFYNDENGIDEEDLQSDPLGKYYVIDFNKHGFNLNIGTNISFENKRFMLHIGYDTKPKTYAFGINWKVK